SLLHAPGAAAAYVLGMRHYPITPLAWFIGLALNVPFYFLLGLLGRMLWLRIRPSAAPPPAQPAAPPPPSRRPFLTPRLWLRARPAAPPPPAQPAAAPAPSRRRFLTAGLRLAGGGAVAGLGYAFAAPRWFQVTHQTFPLRGLPPSLDGLRLVQLTDIHHG